MKKVLLTAVIASMLILPLGNVALADHEQASQPTDLPVTEYVQGGAPAQTDTLQSMSPAIHGVVLAMLNHGADTFSPENTDVAWESLYNMLSMYGQLDDRAAQNDGWLTLPAETVQDYTAALGVTPEQLGPLPEALSDRLVYEADNDCYRVACGDEGLIQFQPRDSAEGGLSLTGALVDLTDGADLARFQVRLQLQDNLFGCMIADVTLI